MKPYFSKEADELLMLRMLSRRYGTLCSGCRHKRSIEDLGRLIYCKHHNNIFRYDGTCLSFEERIII